MNHSSRRSFLKAAIAAPSLIAAAQSVRPNLSIFDYSQVELLDGPLKRQFDTNHEFFMRLDEDRMLKIFRQRAGLMAPGEDMGGWYDSFCPGASFGQYVSALARYAAATGSEPTSAKVKRLVRGYAQTIQESDKVFEDLRYPAYTYDKMIIALIDAHSFAQDKSALEVLTRTTQVALPNIPEKALTGEELRARHKDETYAWDESYTLAENLFLAYERTGNRQYFDLGKKYLLDKDFFNPLSENEDVLPGLHAYSHMNALSSGMQGYLKLGDRKYLRAVTNAMNMIWRDQSYATGGWGPREAFVQPGKGELGKSLSDTHYSFETGCGGYAHFKITRSLLALTRDTRYGDSMEKVLYNALLGIKPLREDGSTFYYSDYHHSGHKTYERVIPGSKWTWDQEDKWPCCSGTFPQVTADYVISTYLKSDDGVYVNLFVPSRVSWSRGGQRRSLEQRTDYPAKNLTTFRVTTSSADKFAIYLRVPQWAGASTTVAVNGKRLREPVQPGSFYRIERTWTTGDKIEFEIDQTARYEAVDKQTPDQVALIRGPQVMFAILDEQPRLTTAELQRFQRTGDIGFPVLPFGSIADQTYQTYVRIAT